MEYLFKVWDCLVHPHSSLKDGHIIEKRENGTFEGGLGNGNWGRHRKTLCVIRDPEDFWTSWGNPSGQYFPTTPQVREHEKHLRVQHYQGGGQGFSKAFSNGFKRSARRYKYEDDYVETDHVKGITGKQKHRKREWFVDFKELLDDGHITQAQYDSIYDKENDHLFIELPFNLSTSGYIHHENTHSRRVRREIPRL